MKPKPCNCEGTSPEASGVRSSHAINEGADWVNELMFANGNSNNIVSSLVGQNKGFNERKFKWTKSPHLSNVGADRVNDLNICL